MNSKYQRLEERIPQMDKREGNHIKYFWKTGRSWGNYRKNNFKSHFNKHLQSFMPLNLNRSRDKIRKYNSEIPCVMNMKPQNNRLSCPKDVPPWSEEAVELERRQQVSDTAKKLMNKLRMWNTETNEGKNFEACYKERSNVALPVRTSEESKEMEKEWQKLKFCDKLNNDEKEENVNMKYVTKFKKTHDKCSNIISSKKIQLRNNLDNSLERSIENKQKKIQENIIGELMAMPKENLSGVLVNPKIHPKLEKKMAQIVKENRLILAQKFRNLAESKINSQGQFQIQTKFINDVENLINPDLAVDLCQLPPELIKHIGDIFQLDFDSFMKNTEGQEGADNCSLQTMSEDSTDDMINCSVSSKSGSHIKGENWNNFEGTDKIVELQENIRGKKIGKVSKKSFANFCSESQVQMNLPSMTECNDSGGREKSKFFLFENLFPKYDGSTISAATNEALKNSSEHCSPATNDFAKEFTYLSQCGGNSNKADMIISEGIIKQEYSSESVEHHQEGESSTEQRISDEKRNCYFDCSRSNKLFEMRSSEMQTDLSLIDLNDFKRLQENDEHKSFLLKELDLIDNLVHALNRRRLLLFLKLVNLNSCESNNSLRNKLIEVVTNGDRTIVKRKRQQKQADLERTDNLESKKKRSKQVKKPRKGALDESQTAKIHIEEETDSEIKTMGSVMNDVKKECV